MFANTHYCELSVTPPLLLVIVLDLVGEPFSDVKTLKEKASHVFTTKKKLTEEEQELFDKTFRGQYVDQLEAFTKVYTTILL